MGSDQDQTTSSTTRPEPAAANQAQPDNPRSERDHTRTDPASMGPTPASESIQVSGAADRPVIEVTVAAPIEVVWPHLRDPELIRRWHGWEFDGLDAEIAFIYVEQADSDDEHHVIRGKGGPAPGSYHLGDRFDVVAADPQTTVVRITRGPLGTDPGWDAMYDDITQGWITFLAQLRFAVEQQLGVERRTVFLARFGGAAPRVHDLLGVGTDPSAVAEQVRLILDRGSDVTGDVWFRTEDQLGLAVEEYGPGLVVLADKPDPVDAESAVVSMIIVSTFGLTDDQHSQIDSLWSQWWSERFPESEPAETP
jgi:hypothetical protein